MPRAGEQLASLSLTSEALDPEEFDNYEVGVKWDLNPAFTVSAALFQLDRSNVVVPDPGNPLLSILVDGQRTRGFEFSAQGRLTEKWSMIAAFAHLEAEITQSQSATRAGRQPARQHAARTPSRCGTAMNSPTGSRPAWA